MLQYLQFPTECSGLVFWQRITRADDVNFSVIRSDSFHRKAKLRLCRNNLNRMFHDFKV
jgi:hypothetical protein